MLIGIMKKGDRVINVTSEFVAVERTGGEVDVIPVLKDGDTFRVDLDSIITIGYGDNIVQAQDGNVTITTF